LAFGDAGFGDVRLAESDRRMIETRRRAMLPSGRSDAAPLPGRMASAGLKLEAADS